MAFGNVFDGRRVALLDHPTDRDAVLGAAARLLSGDAPDALADALRQRERIGSTAIGHGVAIPHARSASCEQPCGAFLRLVTPVDFDAPDGEPVDLVFAMSVPESSTQAHLQVLAQLADCLGDAGFREALRNARDVEALRVLLRSAKPCLDATTP